MCHHLTIQAFLNGVDVPGIFYLSTLVAKVVGSVGSVAGGLAIGKEGPFVHAGAAIAAILSQVCWCGGQIRRAGIWPAGRVLASIQGFGNMTGLWLSARVCLVGVEGRLGEQGLVTRQSHFQHAEIAAHSTTPPRHSVTLAVITVTPC